MNRLKILIETSGFLYGHSFALLMSTKPETRIRQLKQISTAIKNLAGHTAWSHFWNVPAPENPTSGMHDDEFHDFMWDHRYEFGKAVDSPSAKPLTLTSHDIKIFELAVSIVLDVLAVVRISRHSNHA